MFQRRDVREGMVVRSQDGEKLGKVFSVGDDRFHIEKGLFFPKDYRVLFSDIDEVRNDEIVLAYGREVLLRQSSVGMDVEESEVSTRRMDVPLTQGVAEGGMASEARWTAEETRARASQFREAGDTTIPLYRETLDVQKRERPAGEVRVHKTVVSENEEIPVTLRKERARVERRPASSERVSGALNASFQDETIVVPLHAEEAEVQKRLRLDEEVIIHKDVIEEERRIAETVRHEEVDVRTEGDVEPGRAYTSPEDDPGLTRR